MCYETPSFVLEKVKLADAPDLLRCYSDEKAHERMNWEYCTDDFFYRTLSEMENCIRFWLQQMAADDFMRYSVFDRKTGRAVGTIELFDAETAVYRIDLMSEYETEGNIDELITLAETDMMNDFTVGRIAVKAVNDERIRVLQRHGYVRAADFRPEIAYYVRSIHPVPKELQ